MNTKCLVLAAALAGIAGAQEVQHSAPQNSSPLYRVSVVDPTTVAISYGNRDLPTHIGFEGTVLLPRAKGKARIQSRKGATAIDASFEGLLAPQRFGGRFLTYVLWAVTPDGRASNLGQLITGRKDRARLKATTELQTFALIVTAEPYYSVTQPGNVVVLENVVLPETAGKVETLRIKPELLQRGEFTWETPRPDDTGGGQRMVSKAEYEALVELYQARNAVNIARSAGAQERAASTLSRADAALQSAERFYQMGNFKQVVISAREATQAAEDARLLAKKRAEQTALTGTP